MEKLAEKQTYQLSFSFSQEDVRQFAEISGDKNPIHLDAEYAAKTPFKKPIVHGFLAGSVFSKIFGTLFPGEGTIYLKQEMSFTRPVYMDTTYEARLEVTSVDAEKHRAQVATTIVDKETEKAVIKGEATIMNTDKI